MGSGGTGGEGDTAGTGSIEPGGNVKFNLFFDIWYAKMHEVQRIYDSRTQRNRVSMILIEVKSHIAIDQLYTIVPTWKFYSHSDRNQRTQIASLCSEIVLIANFLIFQEGWYLNQDVRSGCQLPKCQISQ